jgi:hypothetical protein
VRQSLAEGLEEAFLLAADSFGHVGASGDELRVRLPHLVDHRIRDEVEKGALHAEEHTMAGRAPQDAPEHVASPFVRGQDSVGDQKGDGASVIREHAEGNVLVGVRAQRYSGDLLGTGKNAGEEVGVECVPHPLEHRGHALETCSGIHRRFGQRGHLPRSVPVELHEHEIPDLEPAAAFAGGVALRVGAAPRGPKVDVDLGAGSTGPRLAHGPEVLLLIEAVDLFLGNADHAFPEIIGLVVVTKYRHDETLRPQMPDLRNELPCELDGLLLEVVPEGEVAQHLEERVMTRSVADVLEVVVLARSAHALLGGGGPRVLAGLLAQENALELHHPCIGEQKRRIRGGHQGRARHAPVAPLLEEA